VVSIVRTMGELNRGSVHTMVLNAQIPCPLQRSSVLSLHEFMQGLRAPNRKQKYEKICFAKLSISIEQLCAGQPPALAAYFQYVRGLGFEEVPDYMFLRRLFRNLFVSRGYSWDYMFDWTILHAHKQASAITPQRTKQLKLERMATDSPKSAEDLINARGVSNEATAAAATGTGFWGRKASMLFQRIK
jgi:hypothetical protein